MPERIFLLSVHDAPTIATVDVTADGFVEDVRLSMFFVDANLRDAALTIGSGATPTFQLVTDALVAIDQLRALGSRMKTTAVVGSAESVGEYADWLRAENYAGELLACPSETIGEACSKILP